MSVVKLLYVCVSVVETSYHLNTTHCPVVFSCRKVDIGDEVGGLGPTAQRGLVNGTGEDFRGLELRLNL